MNSQTVGASRKVELPIEGITDAEAVGRGSFGIVYRAMQPAYRREVAVKLLNEALLDADSRRRFERECQALGSLSGHPNIVTLHSASITSDGHPYLIMDYLSGGSLADRITREGRLRWEDAVDIGVKLCGALAEAHSIEVLHRDVKPENVLVSRFGEPQLADFGVARVGGSSATGTATSTGSITGSLAHASPEAVSGSPTGPTSDVWSLASTISTLIAGQSPFHRDGDESLIPLINRILRSEPRDLGPFGAPDDLCQVLSKGMARDVTDRPQSAEEFGILLQAVQSSAGLPVSHMTATSFGNPPAGIEPEGTGYEASVPDGTFVPNRDFDGLDRGPAAPKASAEPRGRQRRGKFKLHRRGSGTNPEPPPDLGVVLSAPIREANATWLRGESRPDEATVPPSVSPIKDVAAILPAVAEVPATVVRSTVLPHEETSDDVLTPPIGAFPTIEQNDEAESRASAATRQNEDELPPRDVPNEALEAEWPAVDEQSATVFRYPRPPEEIVTDPSEPQEIGSGRRRKVAIGAGVSAAAVVIAVMALVLASPKNHAPHSVTVTVKHSHASTTTTVTPTTVAPTTIPPTTTPVAAPPATVQTTSPKVYSPPATTYSPPTTVYTPPPTVPVTAPPVVSPTTTYCDPRLPGC